MSQLSDFNLENKISTMILASERNLPNNERSYSHVDDNDWQEKNKFTNK